MEKQRVLIVEDNVLNQLYFAELLTEVGFTCVISDSIDNAKGQITKTDFSLILSDYNLGDGNGIDFFECYKSAGNNCSKFILISGYTKEEIQQKHLGSKLPCVLTKPIQKDDFLIRLNEVCNKYNCSNEPKSYSLDKVIDLLKNDVEKIKRSANEYYGVLTTAIELITKVKNGEAEEEVLRYPFHDILNLSIYFGGDALYSLVFDYKNKDVEVNRGELLGKIKAELSSQIDFLRTTPYISN